ncbi:hypothetical protein QFC21_007081 [Naganishia friedmannii]|uniref:Uncharacterized protein n=1 Tax=Naganishia friedmannii TaxID=89922 RepID=A0ACC2UXH7_9TREE|nr:hypothetical protein QFC21_007081 [Naganishia friedmannii]
MALDDSQHASPGSQQLPNSLPTESGVVHRGRPKKYATEEERRRGKNETKRARRRQQAVVGPTMVVNDEDNDWRARKAAREEEKRKEREEERFVAQCRNDFGNQDFSCPEFRSAADVIVNYLTTEDNYNTFKMASTAEKRRMIGEMQEEMR